MEKELKKADYVDLIIQYLYHSLSTYNDLKNKYSFRFFILAMWDGYTILLQSYLKINNIEYIDKKSDNSYDLISLFGKASKFFNSSNLDILPSSIKENLNFFKEFRNYYVHKPIEKESMKSNDFLKQEYINYTYSFVNNFIYLIKKLFNIDKNLLKINLFPNFNNYDYKYPKNNILIKKINEYIKNLDKNLEFDNFFKNNKNNRSNFYDAEDKIKDTGIIDNEGKFKSQELLNYVLNKFPNLKHNDQWTKSSSHVILYVLNLKEEFFKKSEENENWFNDHCLYIEKYNNYLYKATIIPYIKYLLDNYEKKDINKMYFSKKNRESFNLNEINNWNISKYK